MQGARVQDTSDLQESERLPMDIIVEEQGKNFAKILQARLTEIRRQLKKQSSPEDADSLFVLAEELLVYSHSQVLLKLSVDDLILWLQEMLDFLRQHDEDVKVGTFKPAGSASSFLLINTPDVPYLVDSLKAILQPLPQRAMIISHPILTIKRKNGALQSIGDDVWPQAGSVKSYT